MRYLVKKEKGNWEILKRVAKTQICMGTIRHNTLAINCLVFPSLGGRYGTELEG